MLFKVQGLTPAVCLWVSALPPPPSSLLYRWTDGGVASASFFILYWSVYISESQEDDYPRPSSIWQHLETFLKVMTVTSGKRPLHIAQCLGQQTQQTHTTKTYLAQDVSSPDVEKPGLNTYFYGGHVLLFLIREKSYLQVLKQYPYSSQKAVTLILIVT